MTREEIVRLVSRGIAVYPLIWAATEITYLPERMFAIHHYHRASEGLVLSYVEVLYRFEISSLLFRIILLLSLAWTLWACGPRVTRLLMPTVDSDENSQPNSDGAAGVSDPSGN
jgi:hypothetical protein